MIAQRTRRLFAVTHSKTARRLAANLLDDLYARRE
jgi:hypothetical protein